MKTKSLFIAALVTVMTIVTAIGKDEPRTAGLAVVPVKGSELFKVIYRSTVTGKVKLNVYNAQTKLIFSETLSGTDGFILPLNFAGVEPGEYTLEIVDALGKRVEKINYQPNRSKKQVHISKLVNEDGKFLVSVSNANNEKVNVKIFDTFNNLLHSETRQVDSEFAQLYTVKNVEGVTIEISDSNGNIKSVRF